MATMQLSRGAVALGSQFSYGKTITSDGALIKDPVLPAAKPGTLTTRSSNTAGTLTMAAGHGFTNGQIIDIYWATGQCTSATIGTISTNSVPFTTATGDVLPAATTAITAMVQHVETFAVAAAALVALAVNGEQVACSVTLIKADASVVGVVRMYAGTLDYIWDNANGADNPAEDNVATIGITHGDAVNAHTVTTLAMFN